MPMLRRSTTANGAAASSWGKLLQEDLCVGVRVLTGPDRATFTCSNYPHEFPDTSINPTASTWIPERLL
jgi:hypothetical protein